MSLGAQGHLAIIPQESSWWPSTEEMPQWMNKPKPASGNHRLAGSFEISVGAIVCATPIKACCSFAASLPSAWTIAATTTKNIIAIIVLLKMAISRRGKVECLVNKAHDCPTPRTGGTFSVGRHHLTPAPTENQPKVRSSLQSGERTSMALDSLDAIRRSGFS